MENVKKMATRYIELGLPVIPCRYREKIPLLRGWTTHKLTDITDLKRWEENYGEFNIGLPLGENSGIVGIDIDGPKAEKRLASIRGSEPLPKTPQFLTPGGKRILFRLPEGATAKKYFENLEGDHSELAFLGTGQQTILPPSVHPSGERYRWVEGYSLFDLDLALAPCWILDKMGEGSTSSTSTPNPSHIPRKPVRRDEFGLLPLYCPAFEGAVRVQRGPGLDEENWFRWISLLTRAGFPDLARKFSRLSSKHDSRSEERLDDLEDDGTGPQTRCTTFGCGEKEIWTCHLEIRRGKNGRAVNSPGYWLKLEKNRVNSNPKFVPFVRALKSNETFFIDDKGHLVMGDKKGERFLANFLARPVREVIFDDGEQRDLSFEFEGLLSDGSKLSKVQVPASDFERMNWVLEKWGMRAIFDSGVNTKRLLRMAIQSMGCPEKSFIYTHLGWRKIDGEWGYIHSDGAIGREDVGVKVDLSLSNYCLPEPPTEADQKKKALDRTLTFLGLAPWEITVPLLSLAYLAPLFSPLKQKGEFPRFVPWLYGTTGTFKTSIALLLLAHFRGFQNSSPPASFEDTANSLEKKTFVAKDTLLLIDDFFPSSSFTQNKKKAEIAQRLLRAYGDNSGRGRLNQNLDSQKEFSPRGLPLVTGETLPSGESTAARVFPLPIAPGKVDKELLTRLQNSQNQLSLAMALFIDWIRPQLDVVSSRVVGNFRKFRDDFSDIHTHPRQKEAGAWLSAAYDALFAFLDDQNLFERSEHEEKLEQGLGVIRSCIQTNQVFGSQENPAKVFLTTLRDLLNSKEVKVSSLDIKPELPDLGPTIGWQDEKFFYLIPEVSFNSVAEFYRKRGQEFPGRPNDLWRSLAEKNYILCGNEAGKNRFTRKKGINGKRVRVIYLYRAALDFDNS